MGLAVGANLSGLLRALGVRGGADGLPIGECKMNRQDLYDKRAVNVIAIFRAVMLDFVMPVAAEVIETEAIGFQIDDAEQARLECDELCGIDFAFKNRGLDALSVVETGFSGAPQAGFTRWRDR